MDGSEKYRSFYAKLVCTAAKLDDSRIEEEFRSVRREPFAGPGPWWTNLGGHPYVQTPDDDPAYLYQNLLVALDRERGINIGEPRYHACWLAACNIKEAETVVQIGAGSGCFRHFLALPSCPPRCFVKIRTRSPFNRGTPKQLRIPTGPLFDFPVSSFQIPEFIR